MVCTIIGLLIMTDWQSLGGDPCIKYSLFDHPGLADQYKLQLAESNVSESGMVRVQSLQVVEGEVYQLAVNKCEAAGTQCHWIPNSLVTGENCNDCQPMCRSTKRTLNFVQFVIGLFFFYATLPLMFTGIYLLLSESVSKPYQVFYPKASSQFCILYFSMVSLQFVMQLKTIIALFSLRYFIGFVHMTFIYYRE